MVAFAGFVEGFDALAETFVTLADAFVVLPEALVALTLPEVDDAEVTLRSN